MNGPRHIVQSKSMPSYMQSKKNGTKVILMHCHTISWNTPNKANIEKEKASKVLAFKQAKSLKPSETNMMTITN